MQPTTQGEARGPCRVRRGGGAVSAVLALALVGVGCGAAQPTQPAVLPTGAPASSPAPSVSRAPTASPSTAPGTAAITAFVKLVGTNTLAYQATFRGRSRHTTTRLPVKGTIAVSGRDYRVTADFTFDTGTGKVDHRFVGGRAWVRFDGGKWQRLSGFTAAQSMSPFASVDGVGAVHFLETKQVGGKTLYQVEIASIPLHPSLIPASNLTKEMVTRSVLDLLIDEAGRPVSGTATIQGTGRVSGQLQEIIIELTLTFTKVGQKVAISAP
jgi:hypothetical protein